MRIGFEAKRIFHNNTGLGNYGRDVIRMLNEYTPVNSFFLYNTSPSDQHRIEQSQKIVIRYPKLWIWKKLSSIWRLGPVIKIIEKDNLEIYHGLSGEIPIGLRERKIPTVVTIHDLIFFSHPQYYSFFDRIIYSKKSKHAVVNADRIIAISEQTKRDIIKYLKVPEHKIEIVYQGCNAAYKKTYDSASKEAIKSKYGLPDSFILNVGTLQERKNALTIVKAIKDTDYKLVLVGSEKRYAQDIHSFVKKHHLENQVTFLKNIAVTDLATIYQMATLFCYPSLCEGFGIPIIEALFSKVPVITTRGNCFPEAGGPNSVYVDPSNPDSLRNEFDRLFSDREERERIVNEGLLYVQKFSDKKVASALFDVYQKLMTK